MNRLSIKKLPDNLFITKDNLRCSVDLGVDASYKPEDGSVLMIVLFTRYRRPPCRRKRFLTILFNHPERFPLDMCLHHLGHKYIVTILFITKDNLRCSGNLGVDASYKPEDGSVLMIMLFTLDRRHRGRRHPFDFFIYTSAGRDACCNLIAPSRLLISTIEFLLSRGCQATPTILFNRPERFPQT
jgi:hypothetical protein